MLLTKTKLQQPQFKHRVCCKFQPDAVEISYLGQGFLLRLPAEQQESIVNFVRLLQMGGLSPEQLEKSCADIAEEIPELLAEFEQRGILWETRQERQLKTLTGKQFYQELCDFLARVKTQFPPSPFWIEMAEGTINKQQLISYARESYHVTHFCPQLLAPALANCESSATKKLLQEFFVSELHHDQLMIKSLQSVGMTTQEIEQMQPLPMTFSVCSSLGLFARQHPLSFKAALLIFEEDDPKFGELLAKSCQALNLPKDFYQPILLHSKINDDGGHDDITRVLLSEISAVTPTEQIIVKKNLTVLLESLVLRTQEILSYCGEE